MMSRLVKVGVSGLALLAGAAAVAKQPATLESLDSRTIEVERNTTLDSTTTKAAESYRKYLSVSQDRSKRVEAMRRLADLNVETSEIRLSETATTDLEDAEIAEAVALYQKLLADNPSHPNNDRVFYQLARALESRGDSDEALATLAQLVEQFPHSRYADEAYFRRGEILFVQRRFRESELAYAAIVERGGASAFYERALYKLGWSRFKQSFYEQGLQAYFELLDRKLSTDGNQLVDIETLSRSDREMIDDTLRVVSLSFTNLDSDHDVRVTFNQQAGKPYEYLLYLRLGKLYQTKKRFNDAAETFRAYVEKHPYSPLAPSFHTHVIDSYQQGGFSSKVLTAKIEYVDAYGLDTVFWQHNSVDDLPEVTEALKQHLDELTRHFHALAQRQKKASDYAIAIEWYQKYIRYFPNEIQTAQAHFLMAELLFESAQYERAIAAYEQTAYGYPAHAKSVEAGYAALLAFNQHITKLVNPQKNQWQRKKVTSALRFVTAFPDSTHTGAVLTDVAEVQFALGESAAANETAARVLSLAPPASAKQRQTALTIVAHTSFELQRYAQAENAYRQLLRSVPKQGKEGPQLVERVAASIYKQGEASVAAKQPEQAVQHFLRVATVAPTSSIRVNAHYDAAVTLITLKQWQRAASLLESFAKTYPRHPLQKTIPEKRALVYLESNQLDKAAEQFAVIAATAKGPEAQRDAYWRAAELYEQSGHTAEAIEAYKTIAHRFPKPLASQVEAQAKLITLYTVQKDTAKANFWRGKVIRTVAQAGNQRNHRMNTLAANAQLTLADPHGYLFRKAKLTIPLKKSLALKKQRLEQALAEYNKVVDYGVAETTTAATYQIAELYSEFGRALRNSQRPRNLTPDQLEEYNFMLEDEAFPFEEKAIEIHAINLAQAKDGHYDRWVRESLEQLAKLMPARYNKRETGEAYVAAIH